METNDGALLSQYCKNADNEAFKRLIERHSGLVYGTALRLTGDPSAAEEVSQDVFVLLAQKAPTVTSRQSVAGWLHLTSTNMARHELRRRARQSRKLAQLAAETSATASDSASASDSKVDEAIAKLPNRDREAILLRFFEDLDYNEIAGRLDVTEPTARKRVSRALGRLQNQLGPDAASSTALGALSISAPPGVLTNLTSSGVVASTSMGAAAHVISTMTNTAILKTAGVVLGGGLLLYGNLHQHAKIDALETELQHAMSEAHSSKNPVGRINADGTTITASTDALRDELEKERALRIAAESELAQLKADVAPLKDEIVVAYGKVTEIGRDFASLFSEARELSELEAEGKLKDPAMQQRVQAFYQQASSMTGLSAEIIEMESNPDEGSQFFSSAYAELFDLSDGTKSELQKIFSKHIEIASEKGVSLKELAALSTRTDLPDGIEEEAKRLLEERQTYYRNVRAELRAAIPASKHSDFDQWIEEDGIGFKNISLGGMPLMFGLGGKQQ